MVSRITWPRVSSSTQSRCSTSASWLGNWIPPIRVFTYQIASCWSNGRGLKYVSLEKRRYMTFVINKADVCTRNKNYSALFAVEMSKLNQSRPVDHFFISIFLQNCGSVSSQSCCALLS